MGYRGLYPARSFSLAVHCGSLHVPWHRLQAAARRGHDRFCPPSLKHGAHPRNHNGEPSVLTSCSQSPKQRSEPAFPLP